MTIWLALGAVLIWALRLTRVRGLWQLPLRNGTEYFLAQRVPPGFYAAEGAALVSRRGCSTWRAACCCSSRAACALWLAAAGRYSWLFCEV